MDLIQLDRAVVFLEGVLFCWICRVIWKEVVPDIKESVQIIMAEKNSAGGTAEQSKKLPT